MAFLEVGVDGDSCKAVDDAAVDVPCSVDRDAVSDNVVSDVVEEADGVLSVV